MGYGNYLKLIIVAESPRTASISELVKAVCKITGKPVHIEYSISMFNQLYINILIY